MSKPNLRFSLKTLLFLVAIVALLTWEFGIRRPARKIEPLIDALAADTHDEREPFTIKLREIGQPAVPFVLKALKEHDSANVRLECVKLLGEITTADVAVWPLIAALNDVDRNVSVLAAAALGDFGPEATEAVPSLIDALTHQVTYVRVRAAESLGQIGPDSVSAVPSLRKALSDRDGQVRVQAALALWRINGEVDVAVSTLTELLEYQKGYSYTPRDAALALGEIGPDAEAAVPALLLATTVDDGYYTQEKAVEAIQKIDPEIEVSAPP